MYIFKVIQYDNSNAKSYEELNNPKGKSYPGHVIDAENGSYTVSYLVPDAGQYNIFITLNRQPISGSPFITNIVATTLPSKSAKIIVPKRIPRSAKEIQVIKVQSIVRRRIALKNYTVIGISRSYDTY